MGPRQKNGLLRVCEEGAGAFHGCIEGQTVARLGGHKCFERCRLRAGRIRKVAVDFDVGRLALSQRGANGLVDERWCVVSMKDAHCRTSDFLERVVAG